MRKLTFVIAFFLAACVAETPEPTDFKDPTEPPSTPDADGGAANHSLCAAFSANCAYTYIWPLSPSDGPQTCYCECHTQADCAAMPNGQTECGTAFTTDDAGVSTPTFPQPWPTVCR